VKVLTDYDSVFAYLSIAAKHNASRDLTRKVRAKRHTELASLEHRFRSWQRQWILMQGILGEEVVVEDGQDVLDVHVRVVVPGIAASGQAMQAPLLRLVVATSAAVPSKLRQPPVAARHTGTVVTNRAAR
jgi:hypothetical protein